MLDLSYNRIKMLPPTLGKLKQLETLDLQQVVAHQSKWRCSAFMHVLINMVTCMQKCMQGFHAPMHMLLCLPWNWAFMIWSIHFSVYLNRGDTPFECHLFFENKIMKITKCYLAFHCCAEQPQAPACCAVPSQEAQDTAGWQQQGADGACWIDQRRHSYAETVPQGLFCPSLLPMPALFSIHLIT